MREVVFEFPGGIPGDLEDEMISIDPTGYAVEREEDGKIVVRVYSEELERFLKSEGYEPSYEFYTTPSDWFENILKEPFELMSGVVVDPRGDHTGDGLIIRIEPGIAFGTGIHPTTRICARLISKHLERGMRVLDVGTGTGILAILAKKLGAGRVVAVDKDPLAVEVARENAVKNGVDVEVLESDLLERVDGTFDLIVANIVPKVLEDLVQDLPSYLESGGKVVISGLEIGTEGKLLRIYTSVGFEVLDREVEEDWVGLTLRL